MKRVLDVILAGGFIVVAMCVYARCKVTEPRPSVTTVTDQDIRPRMTGQVLIQMRQTCNTSCASNTQSRPGVSSNKYCDCMCKAYISSVAALRLTYLDELAQHQSELEADDVDVKWCLNEAKRDPLCTQYTLSEHIKASCDKPAPDMTEICDECQGPEWRRKAKLACVDAVKTFRANNCN